MSYSTVKGTRDIYGNEMVLWHQIEEAVRKTAHSFYFQEIRTPVIELTEVFKRAIGEETDIVSKEMFEFTDRGDRNITLRPEGTAGVVRAFSEHKLMNERNTRYYYIGPMFRAEKPQKGRQRQFHQIGIEIFGDSSPYADYDVILFNLTLLEMLGLKNYKLKINSVGCKECRPVYFQKLKDYLKPSYQELCENCQKRFHTNTLRVLDCKSSGCKKITEKAPSIIKHLCPACETHFDELKTMLSASLVRYEIDPFIVRGLDYYTKTAFEIQLEGLGAQNAVCGGGRYDGLVGYFDPKNNIPGVGSAIGMERLVIALESQGQETAEEKGLDYFVIAGSFEAKIKLLPLLKKIRNAEKSILLSTSEKNFSKQFKEADKLGALNVLVFGEDEIKEGMISVKNMKSGEQKKLSLDELTDSL
ncbi:MAG TPA: histidine--tRNA ligase [Spirochaetia bacterium]|nr:histidine--tRNA ligase [Spirochaetia bacterium]